MIKLRPISEAKKDNQTIIWAVFRKDLASFTGRANDEAWSGVQAPLIHPGTYEKNGITYDHGWRIALQVGVGGFPDSWIEGWVPMLDTTEITVEETPWSIERQVEHIVKTSTTGIRLHAIMARISGHPKKELRDAVGAALEQLLNEQKVLKRSWSYVWVAK